MDVDHRSINNLDLVKHFEITVMYMHNCYAYILSPLNSTNDCLYDSLKWHVLFCTLQM